jgi:hypothetical protein
MFHLKDRFHYVSAYTIVLLIANIFSIRNISLDDDIVMMLPKIHQNLTKKKTKNSSKITNKNLTE